MTESLLPGLGADLRAFVPDMVDVLKKLSLLPEDDGQKGAASKSAIEDFSLELTKSTQNLIKWGSAGGAGVGLVASVTTAAQGAHDGVLAAAIVATAVVIAAGVIALAKVMDGDVRGRSSTATAAMEARGLVAQSLLDQFGKTIGAQPADAAAKAEPTKPTSPSEQQLILGMAIAKTFRVSTSAGEQGILGVRWTEDEQLEIKLDDNDWVKAGRITAFTAT